MYIPEAGFLVRVHPELCLILSRAQIRALLCSSKSKFIPAQTITLLVLDKKNRPLFTSWIDEYVGAFLRIQLVKTSSWGLILNIHNEQKPSCISVSFPERTYILPKSEKTQVIEWKPKYTFSTRTSTAIEIIVADSFSPFCLKIQLSCLLMPTQPLPLLAPAHTKSRGDNLEDKV
jgi:hypothetical protein